MPGLYYPQCVVTLKVVFDEGQGDQDAPKIHTIRGVRPKSCSVSLNGYREADTFTVEFDAASFPFTPELIRSMGVEIRMFQTDGLNGQQRQTSDAFTDEEELVIAGLVDDARYHADGEGRMFSCSGRDYTSLMLDRQWDPTKSGQSGRFPVGIPIKDAVQQLVNEASNAARTGQILNVKVVGTDENPSVSPESNRTSALVTAGKYHVSKKGKLKVPSSGKGNVHTNKKGVPVHGGSNYWDVIYRQCIRLGFIVFVRGTDVVISTPQTLTESTGGRKRRVSYGRDLASIALDRKLGKETVPQIEVVSYDEKTLKPVSGKYPADADVKKVTTGIGTKKNETQLVVVHGINDPGQLVDLAKMYYFNLARSEATIRFATKDLKDLDGNDLLFLRPGDPVELGFDSILNQDFKEKPLEQREAELLALGYSSDVAAVISSEFDKWSRFRVPFYTKDVVLNWSNNEGISIDVTALNFISPGRDAK
jgi:hypothetical protein